MKKIIALVLSVVMAAMLFAGCGQTETTEPETAADAAVEQTTEPAPEPEEEPPGAVPADRRAVSGGQLSAGDKGL